MTNENHDTPREQHVFGLIPGAWHGPTSWNLVMQSLDSLGYDSVTVNAPANDPYITSPQEIDSVVNQLKGRQNLILVGHSRGANILPHLVGRLSICKLIYVAGSFQPPLLNSLGSKIHQLPPRQSDQFKRGIITTDSNTSNYDPKMAIEMFYHDCESAIASKAVDELRPQRKTLDWPIIEKWPDLSQEYLLCRNDKVINPEWSRKVCSLLNIPIAEIDSGHMPLLSKPDELASFLADQTLLKN